MITVLVADNEERVKEIIEQMLKGQGNTNIDIVRQENIVKIIKKDGLSKESTLKDKIVELEETLYADKKGVLYKSILEVIEKPLFEHILEKAEGNQVKASRILGINRNTMRTKIRKLKIDLDKYRGIR